MPRYEVITDTYVSHMNRAYKAGEFFETVFPPIVQRDFRGRPVIVDGKEVHTEMKISGNLKLAPAEHRLGTHSVERLSTHSVEATVPELRALADSVGVKYEQSWDGPRLKKAIEAKANEK